MVKKVGKRFCLGLEVQKSEKKWKKSGKKSKNMKKSEKRWKNHEKSPKIETSWTSSMNNGAHDQRGQSNVNWSLAYWVG